jgi:hypothetical protein
VVKTVFFEEFPSLICWSCKVGFCGSFLVFPSIIHLVEERGHVARKAAWVSFSNSSQRSNHLRSLNSLKGGEIVD